MNNIPEDFGDDIEKAVSLLREAGCGTQGFQIDLCCKEQEYRL